ncbi:MAG: preprotein translocase subunit Sec61beta [Nanoarchaeota archaeon]|nr:preprotein translocase subunit Sec61beta [Nanoarchaeota archaeon]
MPGGFGGLVRYSEEYPSRLKMKPAHVIAFIIALVAFVLILKLVFPVAL